MPRINVEDRWFSDFRRKLLIKKLDGNELLADGAVLHLWLAAQNRARKNELIPFKEWESIAFRDEFIEVGLAEIRETGVYVCGVDEHFSWLVERAEAGRKGGLKKARNARHRKNNNNSNDLSALANAKQTPSKRLAKPSLPSPLLSSPLLSSSPLPSTLLTSTLLTSKELNTGDYTGRADAPPDPVEQNTSVRLPKVEPPGSQLWLVYKSAFEGRYGIEPKRNAKVNSQLKQLSQRLGFADAIDVIEFYLKHSSAFYIKAGHSLGPLLHDAEKLYMEFKSKRVITATDAKQQENRLATLSQIDRIRRGEL